MDNEYEQDDNEEFGTLYQDEPSKIKEDRESFQSLNYLLDTDLDVAIPDIKEELGLAKLLPNQYSTFKLLMLNLVIYSRPIGVSTSRATIYPPKAWNPHNVSSRKLSNVIKYLEQARLIIWKRKPSIENINPRKQPTFVANRKLSKWLIKTFTKEIYFRADTHIRLRSIKKPFTPRKIIDYKPTEYSNFIEGFFSNYKSKLLEWGIAINDESVIPHPIMNLTYVPGRRGSDKHGNPLLRFNGRWYQDWNQLSSSKRLKQISFKNCKGSLIEIDLPSALPNSLMMYHHNKFYETYPYTNIGSWIYKDKVLIDGEKKEKVDQYVKDILKVAPNVYLRMIQFKHVHYP